MQTWRIDFVSASRIESMVGDPAWAVISITDPGTSPVRIAEQFGPLLRLQFDDLDDDALANGSTGKVFSSVEAAIVHDFLVTCKGNPTVRGILVNCEMGRSRSAAIAWYAASFGGTFLQERRIDGVNLLVLRELCVRGCRTMSAPHGRCVEAGSGPFECASGTR